MPIDPILHEYGGMLIRWLHVIAGIAWIGSSFYFMHLDAALKPTRGTPPYGAAFEVHGGGFYEVKKYLQAPPHLPKELIWHKWQAYATWLSGFGLLVWSYYLNADLYLIDAEVMPLTAWQASGIGVGALVLGWAVYDGLCRSSLAKNDAMLSAALFVFIVALAYGFQQVFSGRGAFIHIGAVMGTIMSANVFMVIIPGQKKIIASLMAGETPDPALGARAKTRSKHNNYLTLPTVFLMLSGHYPMVWSSAYSWVIVALVLVAGAVIRVFYNQRHAGKGNAWWCWAVAALALWLALWISMAASPLGRERLGLKPTDNKPAKVMLAGAPAPVVDVITGRCAMCHAKEPSWAGIAIAPKGVRLETPQEIMRQRGAIYIHAVASNAMPPGNLTGITREERLLLARWIAEKQL
ncbi:MAG: urate hydroxylase PuuD [Bosea sp. (in: a-proteobacteria)]